MDIQSELLKACAVKIIAKVVGEARAASGVIFVNHSEYEYDYLLTAKHTFIEAEDVGYNPKRITEVKILIDGKNGDLKLLHTIDEPHIEDQLIEFEGDLMIIVIPKGHGQEFPRYTFADKPSRKDRSFFAWAAHGANQSDLAKFDLRRNDPANKRYKLDDIRNVQNLHGLSGAGVYSEHQGTLHGIINRYPHKDFENATIECCQISFRQVNEKLRASKRAELPVGSSSKLRIVGSSVVDISQVRINGVIVNLELAMKRLANDIQDDWFHDPLNYVDLLNTDYLFQQFGPFFGKDKYKASSFEQFFVPKSTFTLRQALVAPFCDRIMYMALVGVLASSMEKSLIKNVYSARYNTCQKENLIVNGVEQWKKMKYRLAECAAKYKWVIKIDLLNYYDNINKKLLHEKLIRVCESDNEINAANLLYKMLVGSSSKEVGLPQNCDSSSLLATFYLNEVDVFIQHLAPEYYRFMDDIRIFCSSKYQARRILQTIETELRRCHLSVNGQKTEIRELNEELRTKYAASIDLEFAKMTRLARSSNKAHRNDAFHLSIEVLKTNLASDLEDLEEASRKVRFALGVLTRLGKSGLSLNSNRESGFMDCLRLAILGLHDSPWATPQVCQVLRILPKDGIQKEDWKSLEEIVLKEKYNTYSWQTFQIWLIFAFHRYKSKKLLRYAVSAIERNDETNRPVVAAMIIYMGSVDLGFRRHLLRKFGEGFTHGYFQNRVTLIALRAFPTTIIPTKFIDKSLAEAHPFLHRNKDKNLVFVHGVYEENEDDSFENEQLYSL